MVVQASTKVRGKSTDNNERFLLKSRGKWREYNGKKKNGAKRDGKLDDSSLFCTTLSNFFLYVRGNSNDSNFLSPQLSLISTRINDRSTRTSFAVILLMDSRKRGWIMDVHPCNLQNFPFSKRTKNLFFFFFFERTDSFSCFRFNLQFYIALFETTREFNLS